jgi:hypothetical protein
MRRVMTAFVLFSMANEKWNSIVSPLLVRHKNIIFHLPRNEMKNSIMSKEFEVFYLRLLAAGRMQ